MSIKLCAFAYGLGDGGEGRDNFMVHKDGCSRTLSEHLIICERYFKGNCLMKRMLKTFMLQKCWWCPVRAGKGHLPTGKFIKMDSFEPSLFSLDSTFKHNT